MSDTDDNGKSPWFFRVIMATFHSATRELRAPDIGILTLLFLAMHERKKPISADPDYLATLCKSDRRTLKNAIPRLLENPQRLIVEDGKLWSPIVQAEIDNWRGTSERGRINASARDYKNGKKATKTATHHAEKNQRKQSDNNAEASKSPESRGKEGEPHGGPPIEPTSSTSSNVEGDSRSSSKVGGASEARQGASDSGARDGANRRIIRVGMEKHSPKLGAVIVEALFASERKVRIRSKSTGQREEITAPPGVEFDLSVPNVSAPGEGLSGRTAKTGNRRASNAE